MSKSLTFTDLLDANKAIISECINVIIEHNNSSYKAVDVPKAEQRSFEYKTSNLFNIQLIGFFSRYSNNIKFTQALKASIEKMNYDTEELMMHLNRSPAYIFDLEKLLSNQKNTLVANHAKLEKNQSDAIQKYCKYIHENINDWTIEASSTIEILFKLIHFDFGLIVAIRMIISVLYSFKLINDSQSHEQIKVLTEQLKLKCLGYTKNTNELQSNKSPLLQTYNITPSTKNLSLAQILYKLFAVKISTLATNNLELKLKSVSKELRKNIAFVVIAKDNNDFYFDINNLFDQEQLQKISTNSGISKEYIETFKTLHTTVLPNHIKSSITSYNYSNPNEIYVLWTNDMTNFKVREQPVEKQIIDKIIAGVSSEVINSRNKKFEELILGKISEDTLVSFKQIKYLSFDVDNEERLFIDTLCDNISKYLKSKLKSKTDFAATEDFTQEIINLFQKEFDSFKPFHKSKHIPLQPRLIYINSAIQLTNRIKKDINEWIANKGNISELDSIVKILIDSNDNIYTKFIGSYYLAMSAFK